MRITILKRPPFNISGVEFKKWRVGGTYDVSAELASLLIVDGYARLEMRTGIDRRSMKRWSEPDRRRM